MYAGDTPQTYLTKMKKLIKIISLIVVSSPLVSCAVMETEESLSRPDNSRQVRSVRTKGGLEQIDSLEYVYRYQSNPNNLLFSTIRRNKDGKLEVGLSKSDAKSLGISDLAYSLVLEAIKNGDDK